MHKNNQQVELLYGPHHLPVRGLDINGTMTMENYDDLFFLGQRIMRILNIQ